MFSMRNKRFKSDLQHFILSPENCDRNVKKKYNVLSMRYNLSENWLIFERNVEITTTLC